ncbi:hypothetical protein DITRI_Ditri15bG0099200 [Diplodiscus trichospermus]
METMESTLMDLLSQVEATAEQGQAQGGNYATIQKPSFKATLLGMDSANPFDNEENYVSDEEEILVDKEEDECPAIILSKSEKIRLRAPWKRTLTVKLLGRSVGYRYLLRRVKEL